MSRSDARGLAFNSSVAIRMRAASISGMPRGRATSCSVLQRGVAEAAARHVDDALEGEVVGRLVDEAQIGEGVADFLPLVEARAADHPVGQAGGDEAVLELAHLKRRANQDRDLVEIVAVSLERLDLLAGRAGFLFRIPGAGDGDLLAELVLGAQRLAEAAFVAGDEVGGGGEDVAGGAVVALEPDHLGARKIVLEAQDVVDLGATPAVDRLVVVTDAAEIGLSCARSSFRGGAVQAFPPPLWGRDREGGGYSPVPREVTRPTRLSTLPHKGGGSRPCLSPALCTAAGRCARSRSQRYCATLVS